MGSALWKVACWRCHRVASQALAEYLAAAETLISHLAERSPAGELWAARGQTIRVYGIPRG